MQALGVLLWAMVIQPPQLPPALVGREYSGGPLLASTSICAPHGAVWQVAGGQLPPGLTLSPAGFLTGAATQPGTWRFLVRMNAGCGPIDKEYVLEAIPAPVLDVRPAELRLSTLLGRASPQTFRLRVTGNQPGLSYSVQTDGSPWLSVRQRAGTLPAAGAALSADLVEVSVDTTRLLPGETRALVRISCWRGVSDVRIPVVVNVTTPRPEPLALPIGRALRPAPVPPLPLVAMALPERPQLAPVPPPLTLGQMRIVERMTASRTPRSRPMYRMRRFAATRPQIAPKQPPPALPKPAPVKPEPPKPEPKPSPVGAKVEKKPSGH